MFDITLIVQVIVLVLLYRYGAPILKNKIVMSLAIQVANAVNELAITKEIEDKALEAEKMMCTQLAKWHLKIDVEQIRTCLKAAVTDLRVRVDGTQAQEKKIEN